ncbi:hypothetical protein M426DRAFT_262345 [Hypoxylon sp. CI-4A]|nr:hypothetical protein M426DRAFT_262345 [Hypoxylon sp. CI-4A]
MIRTEDQNESNRAYKALGGYNILGDFHITNLWSEVTIVKDKEITIYRVRLEEGRSCYSIMVDQLAPPLPSRDRGDGPREGEGMKRLRSMPVFRAQKPGTSMIAFIMEGA